MLYPNNGFTKSNLIYGVNLVDGAEGVRQAEMQPNSIAVFVDRSSPNVVFYLKSANEYGMTKTLAAYEGKDITNKVFNVSSSVNMDNYVTKEELKDILSETITEILGGKKDEPISEQNIGTTVVKHSNPTSLQNSSNCIKY